MLLPSRPCTTQHRLPTTDHPMGKGGEGRERKGTPPNANSWIRRYVTCPSCSSTARTDYSDYTARHSTQWRIYRGEGEPAPPPLATDRRDTPVISDNGTVLLVMLAIVLNFDRSTVKHALQNTQNDCHQWLSHSFRAHQIRFRSLRGQGRAGEKRGGEGDGPLTQIPGSSPVLPARHVRPQPGLTTVLGRVTSERLVIVSSQHMICTELQF